MTGRSDSGRAPRWLVGLLACATVWAPLQGFAADSELRRATQALLSGNLGQSTDLASDALRSEPKSRLAHWLQAQSLAAMSGKPVLLNGEDRDLLEEARVRVEVTPSGLLPKNLVVMPRSAERKVPVLLADASRSRIYVYISRNGRPVLIDEFYTTIGLFGADKSKEGDQKTPLGVYRVQYEIRDPRKDGFLGKFAMTLDYPNAFDSHSGRTGSGIWIHGVPQNLHVRAPKASDGCLAIANKDLQKLRKHVRYMETQVVVVPRVEWVTPDAWSAAAAQATKDFAAVTSDASMGGVFFVEDRWPWVVSLLQGNQVHRREYFQRSGSSIKRLLGEKLS
jgi:L,D-peptidoglycan transpeptidase YkuD (ErfK/YbiS/YcfS/YnhG family)